MTAVPRCATELFLAKNVELDTSSMVKLAMRSSVNRSSRGRGGFKARGHAKGRRQPDDTTKLPARLSDQLESRTVDGSGDKELEQRFALRFNKKAFSRKADRKQQRQEKKQRISAHYGRKTQPPTEVEPGTKKRKQGPIQHDDIPKKPKLQIVSEPPKAARKPPTQVKTNDPSTEKRQLERLAKNNPNFYRLLSEQRLVVGDVTKSAFSADEEQIAKYAKKLGIKDQKKMPSAFSEDGLDFLFKGLMGGGESDDEDFATDWAENRRNDSSEQGLDEEEDDSDFDRDSELGINGIEGSVSPNEGDSDESDDEGFDEGFDGQESDESEIPEVDASLQDAESENESDHEDEDEDGLQLAGESDDNDQSENFEQSVEQTDANVATTAKYVPPHLRKQSENQSEQYKRLKRQIQGLLNRLSDANMESIFVSIEECYRNNSRHDVTEILTDSIVAFVGDHANLLDSFVLTYAAFIATLFNVIGVEFGAHIVQTIVELFEQSRAEYLAGYKKDPDGVEAKSKRCTNLVILLAYLYNFEVVACVLIYDIVRMTISELSELDVEILLKMLRICGFQLRADDPLALKDIVLTIQEEVKKREVGSTSTRFKFMVETIMDLKNNKRKLQKKGISSGGESTQQERLKKFVTNLASKRYVHNTEPLRVGLADIRSVKTKGKWWLVGSAWAGHDGSVDAEGGLRDSDVQRTTAADTKDDLLRLAKAQKMNTDVRRSVFIVLMSSEDCVDAFERLLKLNLKDKQEREIVRVLVHCCCQERVYNPYYALVAQKVCQHAHGFKVTFQYALWDAFKAMAAGAGEEGEGMDVRTVSNMAKLYAHLIGTNGLTLTALKALTYTSLAPLQILFLKLFLSTLFTTLAQSELGLRQVLNRALTNENVREGLGFFIKGWAREGYEVGGKNVDEQAVRRGGKIAKEVLSGAS
ncbi:uncharacterized protein SPPG_01463 [Spizellomyces punctatus DAOM BR117]|uniref:MI domain-containing protein n=1 Tax=Spizellomyces punctatus (strain DAOM BR117) TaxID=645134 RepID=A0A0L0HRL8_SPIPD|nr:uncharacterized protein SPPG_01463 [Spizellomyces punctatus DAOM BR117]KND04016.1 hypothetical protein SPPG_01463 [Spizellomyces punctatus DAOM BR117]|eukprot:XP_016612055.1 hypothetical protein SPPG_01463 [Spizellomyces punctatus DAOM BR117]